VTTDFGQPISPPTGNHRATSLCEPYRELIEQGLARRRNAIAIWEDLVSDHGYPHGYQPLSALFAGARTRVSAENQPESHDLNYGRLRENAATILQKRFFSSFGKEMGLHPENQANGR
jgi:hypothetical protein